MCVFDLVFSEGIPSENKLLLLIKVCAGDPRCSLVLIFRFAQAIILFECGQRSEAILRVEGLIRIVDDKSPYITVWVGTRWDGNPRNIDKALYRLRCSSYLEVSR